MSAVHAIATRPLRVLVVDDEELARMRLKSLVAECGEPSAVVVGEAANAAQALVWLATRNCDLLLLDVQMPGRDGTQLAAELRTRSPAPAIVFVTAHPEHALQAFDLEAVDYLTKPVKRERLRRIGSLADDDRARLVALGDQALQAQPCELLVVNDEHAQR